MGLVIANRRRGAGLPIFGPHTTAVQNYTQLNRVEHKQIEIGTYRGNEADAFNLQQLVVLCWTYNISNFFELCPIVSDQEKVEQRIKQELDFQLRVQSTDIKETHAEFEKRICEFLGKKLRRQRESLQMEKVEVALKTELAVDRIEEIEGGDLRTMTIADIFMFMEVLEIDEFIDLWPKPIDIKSDNANLDIFISIREKLSKLMALAIRNVAKRKGDNSFSPENIYAETGCKLDLALYFIPIDGLFKLLNKYNIEDFSSLCPITLDENLVDKRIKEEEELRSTFDSA